jgi:hypothetical protein
MKTFTNSGYSPEAASESPPPPPNPNKTGGSHPPVIKSNTITRFKSSPPYGTIYRITGGFLYAATSSLKRDIGRIFTISKSFHKSKPKLCLLFSP